MEEKKKKRNVVGDIIGLIIVAAICFTVYQFEHSDLYLKIPNETRTEKEFIGTWSYVGSTHREPGTLPEEFNLTMSNLMTKDVVLSHIDEDIETANGIEGIDQVILAETGRCMIKYYGKQGYLGTWEVNEQGVYYKLLAESQRKSHQYYIVDTIDGKTPKDLGFESEFFLIAFDDEMYPEEYKKYADEDAIIGGVIYTK